MNTASLPGVTPTPIASSASTDGKSVTRDAGATTHKDRFERLLRDNDPKTKDTPAVAKDDAATAAVKTPARAGDASNDDEEKAALQNQDGDTQDWPPAALALWGLPWNVAPQSLPGSPATITSIGTPGSLPGAAAAPPETTAGIAPAALPGGSSGASPALHALAPALDALPASTDGEPAPVAAGVGATTGLPVDALPVDNTASAARPVQNPLPSATQHAATAQAIAPDALPIAQAANELADALRQDGDSDGTAPTLNALAAPTSSANSLPRTATVNPLAMPTPELHSEHFDEAIGTRLTWMAEQKIGHAHIRMTPEQLGPVDIRLRLDGDRVHADFNSAQPEVRQALETSLPKLREMLGQQGFQLAQADVGHRQDTPARHPAAQNHGRVPETQGAGLGNPKPAPIVASRGLLDAYA